METLDIAVHVAMGLGLAACAGLRAFLPLLVVGVAGRYFDLPLSGSFEWLSGWPALTVFGAAVVVELVGDKVPVVDHFLDSFQTIVKPVAGAIVMATVISDWSPLYLTVVWIITGGAVAGLVHATKANLRLVSTATTGGLGNPAISAVEDVGAVTASVGSIVAPFVIAGLLLVVLVAGVAVLRRRRRAA